MYNRFRQPEQIFSFFQTLLLCIIFWAPAFPAAAELVKGTRLSPAELEAELKHYRTITTLESKFEQRKSLKSLGIDLESQGKLRMTREKGGAAEVDWVLEKPAYLRLKITESSIESFASADQKRGKPLLENQDLATQVLRPLYAWVAMDAAKISEEYQVFRVAAGRFRLVPKRTESTPLDAIQMQIGKNQLVEEITLLERSHDELRIRFRDTKVESRK